MPFRCFRTHFAVWMKRFAVSECERECSSFFVVRSSCFAGKNEPSADNEERRTMNEERQKELRLITFRVGPETFVLDIMVVRQIIPYSGSTSVPTAPAFVEGIIVLRNEVIPIIDLRDRLYPRLPGRAEQPLVLITHASAGTIGLKVDEVRRIV